MIITPKVRGFICTTTHPAGCEANVRQQIAYIKSKGKLEQGPKRVLVIGASTGYGLSSRITAAFGSDAATIGFSVRTVCPDSSRTGTSSSRSNTRPPGPSR